jgi:hypothetical protein
MVDSILSRASNLTEPTKSNNGGKLALWKALEIAILILIGLNTALTSWTLTKAVALSERVSAIESNRFTARDGLDVWIELGKKVNQDQIPSPEVLRRLESIENTDNVIQSRIADLERRIGNR